MLLLDLFRIPLLFGQGLWTTLRTPRLPGAPEPTHGVCWGEDPALKLLVLGDSTVAGVGATSHAEGLTGYTAEKLSKLSGRAVQWRALGEIGLTAQTARLRLVPHIGHNVFDLIIVSIGMNDVLRLRQVAAWESHLGQLIDALRPHLEEDAPLLFSCLPSVKHVSILPQPLRKTLDGRAALLDEALHNFTAPQTGVYSLERPTRFKMEPHYFCEDRFHPSSAGYKAWADYLAQGAYRKLPMRESVPTR